MTGWRTLRAKRDDHRRPRSANERYHVANELRRIELMQRAVAITRRHDRLDTQHARRRVELYATNRGKLLSRRNRDAGAFSGVPIRCTKQIGWDSCFGVFGDSPAGAKRLVVGMREDTAEPVVQRSASAGPCCRRVS